MIKCLAIDDEPFALLQLATYIKKIFSHQYKQPQYPKAND